MQKVIVDTNVLVSGLIADGFPGKILKALLLEDRLTLCLSPEIWEEYEEVLSREKFKKIRGFALNAQKVLAYLRGNSTFFVPQQKIRLLTDADDDKFLELALEAEADFLITGNTNDFTLDAIGGTQIVTPAAYWQQHRPTDF